MKRKNLIGMVIILLGIGVFCYPLIRQMYTEKRQTELKEAFYEILKDNEATVTPVITDCPPTDYTQITSGVVQPTTIVAVEEHESSKSNDQNSDNVKDRLKGQTVLGIIEIDQLDLIYAVVEGTDQENLGVAIGHMNTTAGLGEHGNCVLAGHRGGISGPYFKDIDQLKQGDSIRITNLTGQEYIYEVTESFLVDPSDTWVADKSSAQTMLTLITCQENGTKRLIVRAINKD